MAIPEARSGVALLDIADDRFDHTWHDNSVAYPRTRQSFVHSRGQLISNASRHDPESDYLQCKAECECVGFETPASRKKRP